MASCWPEPIALTILYKIQNSQYGDVTRHTPPIFCTHPDNITVHRSVYWFIDITVLLSKYMIACAYDSNETVQSGHLPVHVKDARHTVSPACYDACLVYCMCLQTYV